MTMYPLPMRFPVPIDGTAGRAAREADRPLAVGEYIDVTITREGWSFITDADRQTHAALSAADRLEYRRAFDAQVELARETPA